MFFFEKMIKDLNLYKIYVKNDIKSQLSYTLDFWTQMVIWFIYTFLPFIGLSILFGKFKSIGNWNLYSVGILYGIVGLAYDTSRMLGRGFDDFHKLLITGDLDVFFIRPNSIIIQVMGSQFFLRRIAGLVQYLLVLIYSLKNISTYLVDIKVLLIFIFISYVGTLLMFIGLLLIYSAICFFTIQKNLFSDIFIECTAKVGFYPLDYLNKFVKHIFFLFIPVGLTAYIPIKYILFDASLKDFKIYYIILPILAGGLFLIIARYIFLYALKFYHSVNN